MYYLSVALFGALGAAARYGIGSAFGAGGSPLSTLLINVTGCFFLAVTVKYLATLPKISKNLVNAIGTGFVGSFTTFSTFSVEAVQMIEGGDTTAAVLYISSSLVGGFLSVMLGFYLSGLLIKRKELNEDGC